MKNPRMEVRRMKRKIGRSPLVGLLLLCMVSVASANDYAPIKRLTRNNQQCVGEVDDHPCIREQKYRQEDYLAALGDKEIAGYERLADKGDADAMFLLSQIAKETADGKRKYEYREKWLPRAAAAGHPVAMYQQATEAYRKRERIAEYEKAVNNGYGSLEFRYLLSLVSSRRSGEENAWPASELPPNAETWQALAEELTSEDAYTGKPLTDEHYLELTEAAALAEGSGDIAWRLAFSYANPESEKIYGIYCAEGMRRSFHFLKGAPQKALQWTRIAAEKGNIMAAELLCNSYYLDTGNPRYGIAKRDAAESARWCALSAQAMCSSRAALSLSVLYREGIGVPKSAIDALYWERIHQERFKRTRVPLNKLEYVGGCDHE